MISTRACRAVFLFIAALSICWLPAPAASEADDAAVQALKSASTAARRAQIRDSIRRSRLLAKEQANLQEKAAQEAAATQPAAEPAPYVPASVPESAAPAQASAAPAQASAAPAAPVALPIADSLVVKSLNVRNTEIRDVLSGLGVQFGVNILMAPEVQGPITVNFSKMKLKDVLRLIVEENGYRLSVNHGAIKVEKKPAPLPPEAPKPRFEINWDGKRISVDLQKIPLDHVARRLVEATGKNVVVEAGTQGDVTAYFKDVEWPKALRLIGESGGWQVRERDGIWSISTPAWVTTAAAGSTAPAGGGMRLSVKDNLVSLEASQAPMSSVLSSLSSQTGMGTVIYGDLAGTVTMKLVDVKLERFLAILFRGSPYTFWIKDGTCFIGPHGAEGVNNSRLIVLKHLKVDDAMELLPANLSKDAQIKVVKSQNALMVLGSNEKIEGIDLYVQQIDRPVAQILIEALVVDVDMDRIRQYGVDMFLGDVRRVKSAESIYPAVEQVLNRNRSQQILSGIPGLRDVVSLPANFVAKIDALEQEKVLKIRSRPQISTLNGSEATITVGQTQYFLLKSETDFNNTGSVTSRLSERFEKIEANVTLTVTPFVTGEGEITCDIVPDFSEPEGSFDSQTPPTLNHRYLKSKVRLRDGETIVLGGLVKESLNRTNREFPFLGAIPVLGWLFKNNNSVTSRSQLLIFVTPHVYYGRDAHVNPEEYLKKSTDLEK